MRSKWAATLALTVLALAPPGVPRLERSFPEGVPSVDGWERITGEVEVEAPHTFVSYEFFVNPRRGALYEVVRYRVTRLDAPPGEPALTEKVQWHRARHDMRRYECVAQPAGAACRWQEMQRGTPEYDAEIPIVIWIYDLHRRVREEQQREDGGRRP